MHDLGWLKCSTQNTPTLVQPIEGVHFYGSRYRGLCDRAFRVRVWVRVRGKVRVKVKPHCSDNENDNDHDAKRTHSIAWIAPSRIRTRSFNQSRAWFCCVLVFVLVIEACVTGPLGSVLGLGLGMGLVWYGKIVLYKDTGPVCTLCKDAVTIKSGHIFRTREAVLVRRSVPWGDLSRSLPTITNKPYCFRVCWLFVFYLERHTYIFLFRNHFQIGLNRSPHENDRYRFI